MNKRGFTLVELLAVLAILGVIMVMAFPAITSSMQRTKGKHSGYRVKVLESGAESYVNDNKNSFFPKLSEENYFCYVSIQTLIDGNYLNNDLAKKVDEDQSYQGYVKITGGNKPTYEYTEEEVNDNDLCAGSVDVSGDVTVNVFFIYYDGNRIASQSSSCNIANGESRCSVNIPSVVINSKGLYGGDYAGLSNHAGTVNNSVENGDSSVTVNRNNLPSVSYYALYQADVTEFYSNSGIPRTLYRKEYFENINKLSAILTKDLNGTKNFTHELGIGQAKYEGYSVDDNTDVSYKTVAAAAESKASVLYSVYSMNVKYEIGVHVDSISADSDSCLMKHNDSDCSVTAPTITVPVGYTSVGWGSSSGSTTGNTDTYLSITQNNSTYYGNGKRNFTCASVGSITTYADVEWYTVSNTTNKCGLLLKSLSSGTGSYDSANTNLISEYFRSDGANYNEKLKLENDNELITTINTDGSLKSDDTVYDALSGTYWVASGKVSNSTEVAVHFCAGYSTLYYGGCQDGNGNACNLGVHDSYCTSVGTSASYGSLFAVSNSASSVSYNSYANSGTITGASSYDTDQVTQAFETTKNIKLSRTASPGGTIDNNENYPYFRTFICGGASHGGEKFAFTYYSKTHYNWWDAGVYQGTRRIVNASNTAGTGHAIYLMAAAYPVRSGSNPRDVNHSLSTQCQTKTYYTFGSTKSLQFHYRLHVEVYK